jgi:phosphoglycerol transferase
MGIGKPPAASLTEGLQDHVVRHPDAPVSSPDHRGAALVLSIGFSILTLFLIARNLLVTHPLVLGDEYYYSILSRYFGKTSELFAHDPYIPHYPDELYLWIFSSVHLWGTGSYAAAKVLNSVLLGAAVVPIYLTALLFVERNAALFISLISVLGPINSFTAYFMPESCYFLMFWIFLFFFISNIPRRMIRAGAYGGMLLACLLLIKPHALVLLGSVELTIGGMILLPGGFGLGRRENGLLSLVALNASFIITLAVLHVGLFGHRELNVLGFYTEFAAKVRRPMDFVISAARILCAHIVYTSIIFGLPIVVTLLGAFGLMPSKKPGESCARMRVFSLFAILSLALLLVMTAKATVNFAAGLGASELRRVHGRYYDFIFPMFLIAFYGAGDPPLRSGPRKMMRLALLICLLFVVAGYFLISPGSLVYLADYPEVGWLYDPFPGVGLIFWIAAALVIIYYLAYGLREKAAYSRFLVVSLLAGSSLAAVALYKSSVVLPADRAGALVQSFFEGDERDLGLVAGSNLWTIFRCLFQIEGDPSVLLLPYGSSIDRDQIKGARWLLSLDNYNVRAPSATIVSGAGFKIVQIDPRDLIFAKGKGGERCLEGFYEAESWGAWSRGSTIRIDLDSPIEGNLVLRLTGVAFGPNIGRSLNLEVGNIRKTFQFQRIATTVEIRIHLAQPANHLVISGLQPTSPASMGEGKDERRIAVGLVSLTIAESDPQ